MRNTELAMAHGARVSAEHRPPDDPLISMNTAQLDAYTQAAIAAAQAVQAHAAWREGFRVGKRWGDEVSDYYAAGNFRSQPSEPANPYFDLGLSVTEVKL